MFEVELYDGGVEVGTFSLDAIPAEGETFVDNGIEMLAVRVEKEPDSGSDYRIHIEYA